MSWDLRLSHKHVRTHAHTQKKDIEDVIPVKTYLFFWLIFFTGMKSNTLKTNKFKNQNILTDNSQRYSVARKLNTEPQEPIQLKITTGILQVINFMCYRN